jgi:hypothetical protein
MRLISRKDPEKLEYNSFMTEEDYEEFGTMNL